MSDTRLRSFIDRVLRLKEEQDSLAADIREVYAEAKGEGFDKTAMGALVAHLRRVEKKGSAAIEEAGAIFDLYLEAYQRASGTPVATHAHTHEAHDPATGEVIDNQESGPSDEVRTEGIATPPVAGTSGAFLSEPAGRSSDESPVSIPQSDGGAVVAVKGSARSLANAVGVEPSPSDTNPAHATSSQDERAPGRSANAPAPSSDPYDPGDIPAFLKRTDGYASASGRA